MANDILVKVGADISDFARGMKDSQDKLSTFSKATKTNELTVGKLAAAVGITTLAFKAFGMVKDSVNKAFARIDTMEQFERVMTTMTGSSNKAKEVLADVNETVKGTAYGLDVGAKAVQSFVTSNMDVDKATATFKSWGDAVAFYGDGTNATLGSVTDALAKATAKGKIQMDTMNRLAEAGIPAMQIYADATGKSVEEVATQMQKGQIKADEFIDVMNDAMKNGTKNFASINGAAKEAGASWTGTFDNMKAAVARGTISIIQKIDEMLKTNGLPDMRALIADFGKKFEEVLKKIAEAIPPTVEKLMALKDAIEPWLPIITPIAAAFGIFIGYVAGLNTVVKIAEGVWTAFNFVLGANPYVLIVAGLLLIATGLIMAYKKVEWFRDMVDAAWAKIKDVFLKSLEWIKNNVVIPIINQVASFINENLTKIKDFWAKNGEQILALVTLNFKNIWENIKMVMGLIKGIFEMVWPIISGIVQIAWGLIKTFVRNGIDLIFGIIDTVMALIRGDWEGAWNSIKDTAQKIWKNIVKFFEEVDLVQIGKDIIQGLINGIGSMGNAVWKAAENIAKNVKDAIMSFLGVHSPARELIKIGKYTGQGFAIGIENMTGLVQKASEKLADAAIPNTQQISMSYATPRGTNSLSSALKGTINVESEKPGGIVQNLTIISPKHLSPAETARLNKRESQRLAMEVRMR
ncbi:tape measure protein [Lederbergia citri]|uniref:Tape measure protein n=1 Tax=Lederbergia citri TaxID=2833580 RepID=A0A942TCE8_9BACI|nr:tape measure protein [Lederbergia citri]MBS4195326.1 tape measure protein [Lederbergia citri]